MYDLLVVLVANQGRILEKDFLLSEVWPDSFVEEGNITYNIRQLRKALGDDAQTPRFIETIPRRGYRFIANVEKIWEEDSLDNHPSLESGDLEEAAEPTRRRYVLAIAVAVAVVSVLALGAWLAGTRNVKAAPILSTPFLSEKLSTDGMVAHAALSPDGKFIVYVHRDGLKESLWIRQFDTLNNTQIVAPGDYFYGGLCISQDGQLLYFARGSSGNNKLSVYRMPIFGGAPQMIADSTQGWISVSQDGRRLSFVRCLHTDDDYCSLFVTDAADGRNEKRLITRPKPLRIGDNKISPDGKTVAFASGQSRTASNDFHLSEDDMESGTEHDLTAEKFFNISYIAWLPDQSGVLITAEKFPDRYFRIWEVDRSTGNTAQLTSDPEAYSRLNLDAKGTMLLSTTVEPDFRLNLYELSGSHVAPRILTNAQTVSTAPNGRIVFSSDMSGNPEIWSVNPDGSDQRELTNTEAIEMVPIVSPDNKTIYFESNRSGEIHIWQMALDGSNQTQLTREEGGYPLAVSPDGAWVYYSSGLRRTLRRVAADGGREEVVLERTFGALAVSPDAACAAFFETNNGENKLTVMPLYNAIPVRSFGIAAGTLNVEQLVWTPDGKYLAYITKDEDSQKTSLWLQPLTGEPPHQVADLSGDDIAEVSAISFSPDGHTLAVIKGKWKHNAVLIKGLK